MIELSKKIVEKIRDRNITIPELKECLLNRETPFVEDKREEHKTDPKTQWFIGRTDKGRLLKIVFMMVDGRVRIKSAYEPNEKVYELYCRLVGRKP